MKTVDLAKIEARVTRADVYIKLMGLHNVNVLGGILVVFHILLPEYTALYFEPRSASYSAMAIFCAYVGAIGEPSMLARLWSNGRDSQQLDIDQAPLGTNQTRHRTSPGEIGLKEQSCSEILRENTACRNWPAHSLGSPCHSFLYVNVPAMTVNLVVQLPHHVQL